MDEKQLKELLLKENPEFRKAFDDHQGCEKAIEALRAKGHLTEAEADEERELKKKKLALKDRMYHIMLERVRQN